MDGCDVSPGKANVSGESAYIMAKEVKLCSSPDHNAPFFLFEYLSGEHEQDHRKLLRL